MTPTGSPSRGACSYRSHPLNDTRLLTQVTLLEELSLSRHPLLKAGTETEAAIHPLNHNPPHEEHIRHRSSKETVTITFVIFRENEKEVQTVIKVLPRNLSAQTMNCSLLVTVGVASICLLNFPNTLPILFR
jgi:hypothetical protein